MRSWGRVVVPVACALACLAPGVASAASSVVVSQTLVAAQVSKVPADQWAGSGFGRDAYVVPVGSGVMQPQDKSYIFRSTISREQIMNVVPFSVVGQSTLATANSPAGGYAEYVVPQPGVWSSVPTMAVAYVAEVHSSYVVNTSRDHLYWSPLATLLPAGVVLGAPSIQMSNARHNADYWNCYAEDFLSTGFTVNDGRVARPAFGPITNQYFSRGFSDQAVDVYVAQAGVESSTTGQWAIRRFVKYVYSGAGLEFGRVSCDWYSQTLASPTLPRPGEWSGKSGYVVVNGMPDDLRADRLYERILTAAETPGTRTDYKGAVWAGSNVSFNQTATATYELLGDPAYRASIGATSPLVASADPGVEETETSGAGFLDGLPGGLSSSIGGMFDGVSSIASGTVTTLLWPLQMIQGLE